MTDLTIRSPFDQHKYVEDFGNLTLPEYILQKAAKSTADGKTYMLIDVVTGESVQYAEFEGMTRKIGSSLYKRGMRKGDTVVYMTYDMLHIHAFLFGVWRANGIARASYPEDDQEILLERVEKSRAGWILCDAEASGMCLLVASKVTWNVEVIVVGSANGCTSLRDMFEDDGLALPTLEIKPSDTALIFCTSGTTAKSKGAEHTHTSLLNYLGPIKYFPCTSEKPNLMLTKGTHLSGCAVPWGCFAVGKTVLVMARVTKENVFKAIDKYKPGFIWGFAPFLATLVNDPDSSKYDLSSLEFAASGGCTITPALEKTLLKLPNLKAVFNSYGLTEVFPICFDINLESTNFAKFPGLPVSSIGCVYPGVSLKIRDPETGQSLGPLQSGEICVKSQGLFRAYNKDPQATEKAFQDGWFLTGDLGYYDVNQFVFLVDRMKEMFKHSGNHISPAELEGIIGKHSDVAEVCVVGIPEPNGGDHIPRAYVTIRHPIAEESRSTLAKDIRDFANGNLANYKHLRGGVFIVDNLPKGKTGKIDRKLVAQIPV